MEVDQASTPIQATPPNSISDATHDKLKVRETGCTILYDGSGRDGKDPPVDIIFVHELGGGPEKTWSSSRLSKTSENLQEPLSSSKARRRDQIRVKLKSVIGSSQPNPSCTEEGRQTTLKIKTFWPLDFLPKDFPRSRIITFGYDSKAVAQFFSGEAVNQENYHSHARDLLYDVDESRAKDGRKRPIIWIAHSLGGIIVKEVLLQAKSGMGDEPIHPVKDIYDSTRGVLFLGTPHRGSDKADWGVMATRAVRATGFNANNKILKQLASQSPELGNLRARFNVLLKKKDFYVGTYQETEDMGGFGGLRGKVVENESSTIDDAETIQTLPGNHREMCKFSDPNDVGYHRISGCLRAIIGEIPDTTREIVLAGRERLISDLRHKSDSSLDARLQTFCLSEFIPDLPVFVSQFDFRDAIENGDESKVRKLLTTGAKFDRELLEKSGLGLAVTGGKVEVVNILLDNGADIESKNSFSRQTPLMEAIKLKSYVMVDFLLRQGADSEPTDRDGKTPLHIACECGDEAILELLLERKTNIEKRCSHSMDTPLLLSAKSRNHAIVELLLQRGAKTEAADVVGKTSLHIVSESGDEDIAKTLLNANANTEAKESGQQRTPLHYAAQRGYLAIAKHLLLHQASVNAQDNPSSITALHLAAENGHAEVVNFLISRGASVALAQNACFTTALHLASENGHFSVVEVLLNGGADVAAKQYPNIVEKTALHLATHNGHYEVVKLLGVTSNLEEQELLNGNTPLLLAALEGHTRAVKTLLERGADIEAQNCKGLRALHLALRGGHEDLALLLLDKGASTILPGAMPTILQSAAHLGQTSIVQKLLDLGVDIEEKTEHGDTALHYACSAGQTTIVSMLLAEGAKFDTQNNSGLTALQRASYNGQESTVRLLLNCGADAKLKSSSKRTALHDAASRGHEGVVKLLIRDGVDSMGTDQNLVTPLHLAAASGHTNIIQLLLPADAATYINIQDVKGQTPLFFACQYGHESTVALLLKKGAQVNARVQASPLIIAAARGHLKVIENLFSHGDCTSANSVNALLAAVQSGHIAVIKKILNMGKIDVNVTGKPGLSALHFASIGGHDDAIQLLLKEGADVDLPSAMGWSPIYGAALNGHSSATRTLLNAGSGVGCLQEYFIEDTSSLRRSDQESLIRLFGQYAHATRRLFASIKNCDIPSIRDQITNKRIINTRDGNGNTALHATIAYNCIEAIPILCEGGIDVNTENSGKRTALHEAVLNNNIEAQRLLLQYGVDMNEKDFCGFTPLHHAIYTEQEMSVKILLEAGADTTIQEDTFGMNAHGMAEERGYKAILPLLSG